MLFIFNETETHHEHFYVAAPVINRTKMFYPPSMSTSRPFHLT